MRAHVHPIGVFALALSANAVSVAEIAPDSLRVSRGEGTIRLAWAATYRGAFFDSVGTPILEDCALEPAEPPGSRTLLHAGCDTEDP